MARLVARRDEAMSKKEARYASRVLNMRLSAACDDPMLGAESADSVPSFLRRRGEQGKGTGNA
jgi:hypothetical protein